MESLTQSTLLFSETQSPPDERICDQIIGNLVDLVRR